jgi:hypothetical protein
MSGDAELNHSYSSVACCYSVRLLQLVDHVWLCHGMVECPNLMTMVSYYPFHFLCSVITLSSNRAIATPMVAPVATRTLSLGARHDYRPSM